MLLKPVSFMRAATAGGDAVIDDLPGTATGLSYFTMSGSSLTEVGGGVDTWGNLFTSANDMRQTAAGNRPVSTTYDSQSCIEFDRGNTEHLSQSLSLSVPEGDFLLSAALAKTDSNGSTQRAIAVGQDGTRNNEGRLAFWRFGNFREPFENNQLSPTTAVSTSWFVYTLHGVAGTWTLYIDGVSIATDSASIDVEDAADVIDTLRIGYGMDRNPASVACAGLFFATGTMDATYRGTVEAAMAAECGVTL